MNIFEDCLLYFTSEDKRLLFGTWLRPVSSDELMTGLALMKRIVAEKRIELCLTDASNCNSPNREDMEWIIADVSQLLAGNDWPLRRLALVKPRDVFSDVIASHITTQVGQQTGSNAGMQSFATIHEAYTWLISAAPQEPAR